MKQLSALCQLLVDLRDPQHGDPWIREQELMDLIGFSLQEIYELEEAIKQQDVHAMQDEMSDLLLHVIFYLQIAKENKWFDIEDVAKHAIDKQKRRAPHLYSNTKNMTASQAYQAWEQNKAIERQSERSQSALDNIPTTLPALLRCYQLQSKAANVGFDWPDLAAVFEKLNEETAELQEVIEQGDDRQRLREELGDMLFCCVNIARKLGIDPESALRDSNQKFTQRFQGIEAVLRKRQQAPEDVSLEELEKIYQQVKQNQKIKG